MNNPEENVFVEKINKPIIKHIPNMTEADRDIQNQNEMNDFLPLQKMKSDEIMNNNGKDVVEAIIQQGEYGQSSSINNQENENLIKTEKNHSKVATNISKLEAALEKKPVVLDSNGMKKRVAPVLNIGQVPVAPITGRTPPSISGTLHAVASEKKYPIISADPATIFKPSIHSEISAQGSSKADEPNVSIPHAANIAIENKERDFSVSEIVSVPHKKITPPPDTMNDAVAPNLGSEKVIADVLGEKTKPLDFSHLTSRTQTAKSERKWVLPFVIVCILVSAVFGYLSYNKYHSHNKKMAKSTVSSTAPIVTLPALEPLEIKEVVVQDIVLEPTPPSLEPLNTLETVPVLEAPPVTLSAEIEAIQEDIKREADVMKIETKKIPVTKVDEVAKLAPIIAPEKTEEVKPVTKESQPVISVPIIAEASPKEETRPPAFKTYKVNYVNSSITEVGSSILDKLSYLGKDAHYTIYFYSSDLVENDFSSDFFNSYQFMRGSQAVINDAVDRLMKGGVPLSNIDRPDIRQYALLEENKYKYQRLSYLEILVKFN